MALAYAMPAPGKTLFPPQPSWASLRTRNLPEIHFATKFPPSLIEIAPRSV